MLEAMVSPDYTNKALVSSNVTNSIADVLLDQIVPVLPAAAPPTRAEATSDKDAVIAEVNTNETKIDTIDGYHDVPTADATTDAVIRDVVGRKTDTANTTVGTQSSLMRYVKGIIGLIAGLATPTNITAGTLTTVTNLTNAPTAGDLTGTMKTSVTAAVPSVSAIQTGLATPTNITAGTITTVTTATTVTNLTNAPTNGDLTATMKTSVQTAADAALTADNLDHLVKTATGSTDMTTEVPDATVISRILSKTSDTSTYTPATDSLEMLSDKVGAYSGDGGAAVDDSIKAQLDLLLASINVARNGVAFTLVFPIYKNDGTLIASATGLDSQISKDLGTAVACTNEAVQIATTTGTYYLVLTATEMTATQVMVYINTTSTGAVIPTFAIYPKS